MTTYFLSVSSGSGGSDGLQHFAHAFGGLRLFHGSLLINGDKVKQGGGALLRKGDTFEVAGTARTHWVRFDLSHDAPVEQAQGHGQVSLPVPSGSSDVLLRMDEVKFPPSAVAFRHIHPGDGLRFLTVGELSVVGDEHLHVATPGRAWFETANFPVRAEASPDHAMTSFLRFMVLPPSYLGKPSFNILDKDEVRLPQQQITRRHFDQIVHLEAG